MTPDKTHFTFAFYRDGLRGFDVRGKTVLDFGAGALHPLDMSLIFWLNGAERCIGLDQRPIENPAAAIKSHVALIQDCRRNHTRWLLPNTDLSAFKDRLARVDEAAIEHMVGDVASLPPYSVDVVVSATVLEHVADLDGLAMTFRRLLKPGGVMYHNVDYTDHGVHVDPSLNYWSFMTEGHEVPDIKDGGDINKLRNSEVETIFRGAGFTLECDRLFVLEPPPEVWANLLPQYRHVSGDDMRIVSSGLHMR